MGMVLKTQVCTETESVIMQAIKISQKCWKKENLIHA